MKLKSQTEVTRIIDEITKNLWDNLGYMKIYHLGAINQLVVLMHALKETRSFNKDDILEIVKTYKDFDGMSDLVDIILEEFNYQEK